MSRSRPILFAAVALLALSAAASWAQSRQGPTIMPDAPSCLPVEDNGVVTAKGSHEAGGSMVRLYFRWQERGDFYFVPMTPKGGGRYWTVLPKAERRNEMVQYYGSVVQADGRELARSKMIEVTVKGDCRMPLTEKEAGQAQNLIIGETVQ